MYIVSYIFDVKVEYSEPKSHDEAVKLFNRCVEVGCRNVVLYAPVLLDDSNQLKEVVY